MKVADFDFPLPEALIAREPAEKRDSSRLLVLRSNGEIEHKFFYNLPEYLGEGDMLLLNNTGVFPARLSCLKPTGGRIDILLVRETGPDAWEILSRGKYSGAVSIAENFSAEIKEGRVAHFRYSGDFMKNLREHGDMPLPPYIKRKPVKMDKKRYQTIYAKKQGSIAAPTAGLHFTEELIQRIKDEGVCVRYLTLHVGTGTFRPIKTEDVERHAMDSEYFELPAEIISEIKKANALNKKVVSVGTTTTRAIEGYFSGKWEIRQDTETRRLGDNETASLHSPIYPFAHSPAHAVCGSTDIFIYPGYEFKAVNSLITNFHLPRSTPLMLASALCGADRLKKAYNNAMEHKYRFFSYGDAMLIL